MHSVQQPYRELYNSMNAYEGDNLFDEIVRPWLSSASDEKRWLEGLRGRLSPDLPMDEEENWRLYALSRIVDLLSLGSIPRRLPIDKGWTIAQIDVEQLGAVMAELGLERFERPEFQPFFHEIVSVDQASDAATKPFIVRELSPGFRLGELLIARARCHIASGSDHIVKGVAENSTMYWAFARNNRPASDLSDGWGSNSQWRTRFRLDYVSKGSHFFNAGLGAQKREMLDDSELTHSEKLELLRHRSFVRCAKDHTDRWPYRWSCTDAESESDDSG